MRAAVSDVNFISIEECARLAARVHSRPTKFDVVRAIGDICASAQRDVSTWRELTIS